MEVKGTALASVPEFVLANFGKAGHRRWIQSLSDIARGVYQHPIRFNDWYPLIPLMRDPTMKICELFYNGDLKGAWEAGRFSAGFALHGIYKLFVKLGSIESLIKRVSVIFSTYYRPSTMIVFQNLDKRVTLHLTQFPELDTIIEYRIAGWIERAVEISGREGAAVTITESPASGDAHREYIVTWEK